MTAVWKALLSRAERRRELAIEQVAAARTELESGYERLQRIHAMQEELAQEMAPDQGQTRSAGRFVLQRSFLQRLQSMVAQVGDEQRRLAQRFMEAQEALQGARQECLKYEALVERVDQQRRAAERLSEQRAADSAALQGHQQRQRLLAARGQQR